MYALYFPSAVRPVGGVTLEYFLNRELAARLLMQRNRLGVSPVYWAHLGRQRYLERPVWNFPNADETGYLRAFQNHLSSPPGLLERPDEEWLVETTSRGADKVVRIPWCDGDDSHVVLAVGGESLTCMSHRQAPTERDERAR